MKLVINAVLALLLLTACETAPDSDQAESESANVCEPASQAAADSVAEGLTVEGGGSLEDAVLVEIPPELRNDQDWPPFFLAARITGPGMGEGVIGVWAVGDRDGGGPIFALNAMAREFSTWGAAAQEGSQAAENRNLLASYEQAQQAEGCV